MNDPIQEIPRGFLQYTPSDTKEVDGQYTGIYLESGGSVAVQFLDDSFHVYGNLLMHTERWGQFKKIMATGTTVTAGDLYLMKSCVGAK